MTRKRRTHEFDGDLLVVQQVGAFENDTERTFTNLLANSVVDTHNVRRRRSHCGRRVIEREDASGKGTMRGQRLHGRWGGTDGGCRFTERKGKVVGETSIRDTRVGGRKCQRPSLEAVDREASWPRRGWGRNKRASRGPKRAIYGNGFVETRLADVVIDSMIDGKVNWFGRTAGWRIGGESSKGEENRERRSGEIVDWQVGT